MAITFAGIFILIVIWREVVWFRRMRRWHKITGYVSEFWKSSDGGPGGPIIRYRAGSDDSSFHAPFCLSNPGLGETVEVLYDPESGKSALFTKRHRWFPTLLCLGLFMFMVFLAYKTH